jgi:hypothetical protein
MVNEDDTFVHLLVTMFIGREQKNPYLCTKFLTTKKLY